MNIVFCVLAFALVALHLQETSASKSCQYSCVRSYTYKEKCGWLSWSRCTRTGYRTGTCYRACTDGKWSTWATTLGTCSKSCGNGLQGVTKRRRCTPPTGGGRACSGSSYSYSTQRCNTRNCPVHGGWSSWSSPISTSCSKSCGSGTLVKSYTRSCNNPIPRYNGRTCSGSTRRTETASCNRQSCPINGGYTSFRLTRTGSCSVVCGGGTLLLTYVRSCTNPTPRYGGRQCVGSAAKTETRACNTHRCPVDGGWSEYSLPMTGDCSVSCGGGTKLLTYTRTCTAPSPQYGGDACIGQALKMQTAECNTHHCPIHGGYNNYTLSNTGVCSVTCGGGTQQLTYSRTCINPSPRYGGRVCSGASSRTDSQSCNTHYCPINGGWSEYSLDNTGACSVSCGGGSKVLTYTRTCTEPAPQYGGDACAGYETKVENEECNTHHCPIHGGYNNYTLSNTGACSVTCGGGTQQLTYIRYCNNPSPRYGGRICSGDSSKLETQSCNTDHCPINGGWSDYSLNITGACSVSCGGGSKVLTYTRTCTEPAPQYGGDDCTGEGSKDEEEDCNTHHCPINGGWTEYALTATGACSVTCGGGEKILTYSRSCTNPSPQYGGDNCDDSDTSTDTENCNENPCPVNGGWTQFSAWGEMNECDVFCGGGNKDESRERSCTDPSPAYGGDECDGVNSQSQNVTCNTEDCGDKCPEGQLKFLAHASNQYKYYQCAHGIARLRDCAPATMWSQTVSVCVNIPVAVAPAAPTHAPVVTACTPAAGFVADTDDCHRFKMCINGNYLSMPCAAGTGFNPTISRCDMLANIPNCS